MFVAVIAIFNIGRVGAEKVWAEQVHKEATSTLNTS